MTVEQRRQIIASVLETDAGSVKLAARISQCQVGRCDRCGDLCPVKASNWADENEAKVVALLSGIGSMPVLQLRYTKESWNRSDGELALLGLSLEEKWDRRAEHEPVFASLVSVEKALRRAFDKLNEPKVVAVGMIDAWYGYKSWKIGGSLIIAGIAESELYRSFPTGEVDIKPVSDIRRSLRTLLAQSRSAKRIPPLDAVLRMPRRRQQEYFVWLAKMEWNTRLFRYGCDRYFNRLATTKKPMRVRQKKGHPYPRWLEGHMFNNHPNKCQCRACGGLGKYYQASRFRS
jgi:hypothetical protein